MLKLHAGISKKVGLPGFSSASASCTIEAELDSSLLQDHEGFQVVVQQAYHVDGGRKRRRGDRVAAVQNGGAQPCSSLRGDDRGDSPEHAPFQREAQEWTATWRSGARYAAWC